MVIVRASIAKILISEINRGHYYCCHCRGPLLCKIDTGYSFNLHKLTLIPAWISNHIHHKVWDEITHPFPNFDVTAVKFENGWVISLEHHIRKGNIINECKIIYRTDCVTRSIVKLRSGTMNAAIYWCLFIMTCFSKMSIHYLTQINVFQTGDSNFAQHQLESPVWNNVKPWLWHSRIDVQRHDPKGKLKTY